MAGKVVEKDSAIKVAWYRLSVLEMAETLGNISEACRRGGMDRTSLLMERHIGQKIRRDGGRMKGPAKRTKEDNDRFEAVFTKLLDMEES